MESKFARIARQIASIDPEPIGPSMSLEQEIELILRKEFGLKKDRAISEESTSSKKFNIQKPHTFQEWSQNNYRIKKGQKATGRNELNIATFTYAQVTPGDPIVCEEEEE